MLVIRGVGSCGCGAGGKSIIPAIIAEDRRMSLTLDTVSEIIVKIKRHQW